MSFIEGDQPNSIIQGLNGLNKQRTCWFSVTKARERKSEIGLTAGANARGINSNERTSGYMVQES